MISQQGMPCDEITVLNPLKQIEMLHDNENHQAVSDTFGWLASCICNLDSARGAGVAERRVTAPSWLIAANKLHSQRQASLK